MLDQPIERVAYGLAEAAEALGIGLTAIREIVDRRSIRIFRLGRRILIRKSDLRAFVDKLYCEQNGGGV